LNFVMDYIGEDRLVFASDYNHGDSKFPHTVEAVTGRKNLSESQMHKQWATTRRGCTILAGDRGQRSESDTEPRRSNEKKILCLVLSSLFIGLHPAMLKTSRLKKSSGDHSLQASQWIPWTVWPSGSRTTSRRLASKAVSLDHRRGEIMEAGDVFEPARILENPDLAP